MPDYHQQESLIQGSSALIIIILLLSYIPFYVFCNLDDPDSRLHKSQNKETLIFINIMEYKAFKVLKLWLEFKLATC